MRPHPNIVFVDWLEITSGVGVRCEEGSKFGEGGRPAAAIGIETTVGAVAVDVDELEDFAELR